MQAIPDKRTSKFLSLVLRHKPETTGLTLDENGWANTQDLVNKLNQHNVPLTLQQLKAIVANNDKQRFIFSDDFSKLRANQGHSIPVDLQLKPVQPPAELYHGTAKHNIESIKLKGITKGKRHHVHLSSGQETASKVGMRYGDPVVLIIASNRMHLDGHIFYQSENGVWLTDFVPVQYISF